MDINTIIDSVLGKKVEEEVPATYVANGEVYSTSSPANEEGKVRVIDARSFFSE